MSAITCPHCGVINANAGAFCESCGKALPSAVPAGPRVVSGTAIATTAEGLRLQTEEVQKQAKKAANALLTVACLTTLGAVVIGLLVANAPAGREMIVGPLDVVINGAVAAIFFALYFWARKSPLPAAIVGLVLYVSLTVAQFIILAILIKESAGQEHSSGTGASTSTGPTPGLGGIWIKVIIIMMFVRAIKAGIEHRRLLRLQAGQPV